MMAITLDKIIQVVFCYSGDVNGLFFGGAIAMMHIAQHYKYGSELPQKLSYELINFIETYKPKPDPIKDHDCFKGLY